VIVGTRACAGKELLGEKDHDEGEKKTTCKILWVRFYYGPTIRLIGTIKSNEIKPSTVQIL